MNQSAAPQIQIQAEVTRQIRQHARSSMATEVCGVLIGDLQPGSETNVAIVAAIAAVNAAQAGTHVTFTQDAWEHIYKIKDAEYPDARIVGWYHSHPGFGVFLSEHDTFIQENFFSAPSQVAWVFDPHTDEEGCFGWIDGSIRRLESITIADTGSPANVAESRELAASLDRETLAREVMDEEAENIEHPANPGTRRSRTRTGSPPRWLRWAASASALLAALLLGFALSRILFPSLYPLVLAINPLTGQPLLRDPKTGGPVYLDPEARKYLTIDPHTGKMTQVDPGSLRTAQPPDQPPDQSNPFPQSPPPPSANQPPKEKK